MDGRGRLLRSVTTVETRFAPAPFFLPAGAIPRRSPVPRGPDRKRRSPAQRILGRLAGPGTGAVFAIGFLAAIGLYGAVRGGHYDSFVAAQGAPADVVAKAFGFAIETITISGLAELDEAEILAATGISPRHSLAFLDAAKIRERLLAIPYVKGAGVAKLYPDRLMIEIEERRPYALWQKDGEVVVVADDGTPLETMRASRFVHLPHVVGTGANEKAAEYVALLAAAGELREQIRAGVLVSRRRWTLKTTTGLDIHLPETDPAVALAALARVQRSSGILDKDLLSLDLRQPGRIIARLSEDAIGARAETAGHKTKSKGGQT